MKRIYFALILLGVLIQAASAQSIPIQVIGTTSTQAVLHYKAPDANACVLSVVDPNTAASIHDLDTALFGAGANLDTKAGHIANGMDRTVVIGHRASGDGVDGKVYSLALQTVTTYTLNVSCNSGSATGSATFTTANIPFGNSAPDVPPYDANGYGGYGWPTINLADKSVNYIDPQTGLLLKRWTGPGETPAGGSTFNGEYVFPAVDLSGSWSNPGNLSYYSDGQYATYSGAGGPNNSIFLWGNTGLYKSGFSPIDRGGLTADDVKLHLNGHGSSSNAPDRVLDVCLSADFGSTCLGSPIQLTLPKNSDGDSSGPSSFPTPLFHGWGDAQVTMEMLANQFYGQATVSGSTVTWTGNFNPNASTATFPMNLKSGMKILLSGTDPVCPQNLCTISNIIDEKHLAIQQSIPNWTSALTTATAAVKPGDTSVSVTSTSKFILDNWDTYAWNWVTVDSESTRCFSYSNTKFSNCSPAFQIAHANGANVGQNNYYLPNFGFKIWKDNGNGTIYLDNGSTDWASSSPMWTDNNGTPSYCSSTTATATYAADGVTPTSPTPGYICQLRSTQSTSTLYWVAASTGEARKLSNLAGLALQLNNAGNPLTFYAFNQATYAVQQCTYNVNDSINGRLKAWSDGYNSGINNPAISCSQLTRTGYDLKSEIAAAYPQIDFNYFGLPQLSALQYPLAMFQMPNNQGYLRWYCVVDTSKTPGPSQVLECHNSWTNYPMRWVGQHANSYLAYANTTESQILTPLNAQGTRGLERWDLQLSTIYNNGGSLSLSNSFYDPQTCEQLGVTDSRWITQGATGRHCIKINVKTEPLAFNPSTGDLLPFTATVPSGTRPGPWAHNSAACGGDGTTSTCASYLTNMAEGDWLFDSTNYDMGRGADEKFLIAKKTVLGNGTIDLVLMRNPDPWGCSPFGVETHNASSGNGPFNLSMFPPDSCSGGLNLFVSISDPTSILVDNPLFYAGHSDGWGDISGKVSQIVPYTGYLPDSLGGSDSSYGVRLGKWPSFVGQGVQWVLNMRYPFGGDLHGLGSAQLQSHMGGGFYNASFGEMLLDGRPLGTAGGGVTDLWAQHLTPISGDVYQVAYPSDGNGNPIQTSSGFDVTFRRKLRAVVGSAGVNYLHDISGPGSNIALAAEYTFCIADVAGECVSGSATGSAYVKVPAASPVGSCTSNITIHSVCLETVGVEAQSFMEHAYDRADHFGLRARKLTMGLNGYARTTNYSNMHGLPTGDWGVTTVEWEQGQRSDVFGVKLPPLPTEDSIVRNDFIKIPVNLSGQTGTSVRARFGYDQRLFCSQRQDQCSTAKSNVTGNLASSVSASTLRNDFSGYVGAQVQIGTSITVSSIGRLCISGNQQTHTVVLTSNSGTILGSASVNMSGCSPGKFVYVQLASPVSLQAGTYYLLTLETAGGDQWSNVSPVTVSTLISQLVPAYSVNLSSLVPINAAQSMYVGADMQYSYGGNDPYSWMAETQTSWTPCSAACSIPIPAISGRVLYYVIDRQDSSGNVTSGPMTITVVK